MELFDILELVSLTEDRIDVLWNVFITVHFALFGALILIDRMMAFGEQIFAFMAYSIFAVLNYGGLADAYTYLNLAAIEIARMDLDPSVIGYGLAEFTINRDLAEWPFYVLCIHIFAAGIVLLALNFNNAIARRKNRRRESVSQVSDRQN